MKRIEAAFKNHPLPIVSFFIMLLSFLVNAPTGEMVVSMEWNGIAMAFVMTIVMTVLLAAVREALRVGTLLESAGFNPLNLAVHWDVPSLAIFFVTFLLVGGTALAYIFISAWKAGLATAGQPGAVWTPSAGLERLGFWASALLGLWIVGYFVVGFAVVLQ